LTKKSTPYFEVGDIVFDTLNKDIGVLLRRYDLFEDEIFSDVGASLSSVMVWDIFWTGPNLWPPGEVVHTYTEEGLEILFDSGVLVHYKNI
jgi:hypothetical protein